MKPGKPRITAKIAGRALHPLLRPFAVGYFLTACAADLIYTQASVFVRHSVPEFAGITEWLLIAGLVMAVLAAVVAVIDLLGEQQFRTLPDLRMYAAGSALVIGAGGLQPASPPLDRRRRHHARRGHPVAGRDAGPAGDAVAKLGADVSLSKSRGLGTARPMGG